MLLVRVEILVLLPTKLTDIAPSFCRQENTQSKLFSFTYRKTKKKKNQVWLISKEDSRDQESDAREEDGNFHQMFPSGKMMLLALSISSPFHTCPVIRFV